MLRALTSLAILSLCLPIVAIGAVIHVPADQPTIQAGIDAAVDGDTVIVLDGVYSGVGNRDISFEGKAITVISENGPDSCVIDCQSNGRGFSFHSGETNASILSGFQITNGSGSNYGGGLICIDSSPVIVDCIFLNNHCPVCTSSKHFAQIVFMNKASP